MGDRNGFFMTLKRYFGHKRNGGDWQDGVTRVTDRQVNRKAGGRGDKGTSKYAPCACLNKQKSLANVQAAKAFAHSRGVAPTRGTIICCTTRLYILSLNCFLL